MYILIFFVILSFMEKFNDVSKKTIQQLEAEVLKFWKENEIFKKSVENRSENNQYVFYEGPPFISGLPHFGHFLCSIAKDIIPRYWTMKGKRVERVWGWDAHGLTIENKVQKQLQINNRKDIESFGLEEFTKECYKYTSQISLEWSWYIDRIGRWVDIENAYITTNKSYMESVIWAFKQLYDKGLIYEGVRTSLYCPTCGTPVSNFEITMDNSYKMVEDPSIIIKFMVSTKGQFQNSYILAWTTTPWTLPSNKALVVDPTQEYVEVVLNDPKQTVILAKPKVIDVLKNQKYTIKSSFMGSELINLSYVPLYNLYPHNENDFKVYSFENMVQAQEGVGIVHCAPGFGEIDTEMGYHYGLSMTMAIDDEGNFKEDVNSNVQNPYKGMYYKKANKFIREDLLKRNLMFDDSTINHRYPYHDRCNTLLIHRAQNSWFFNVKDIKDTMLIENENINWVPSHLKHGQFKSIIQNSPDWCISRNRYWATPMPVWKSNDGDTIVLGSIKEIEELCGKKVTDLHRPYIDDFTINKNGKVYKRIPEVLDCWFESGSMPFAQIHYPFENKQKFEQNFPGDFTVEYIAQVRAWFNVMHRLSVALFNKNPFMNVISTGTMAGSDGRKMSKTYGNYTDPKKTVEQIGGDAIRLYLMSSPLMIGENANFDEMELNTKLRNVLNPLLNSYNFFVMYANIHNFDVKNIVQSENVLDKWIIARLNQVSNEFCTNIEKYHIPNAVKPIQEFVDDLSRWYVRRSRERINNYDINALSTLYTVLLEFSKISASTIPFISETIYQGLYDKTDKNYKVSVHLCDYPLQRDLTNDEINILNKMSLTRDIVTSSLSLRVENGIKVRQPLSNLYVYSKNNIDLQYYNDLICDEVNVKNVISINQIPYQPDLLVIETNDLKVYLDKNLTPDLILQGLYREFIRNIQDLRKQSLLKVTDRINVYYPNTLENKQIIDIFELELKQKVLCDNFIPSQNSKIQIVKI